MSPAYYLMATAVVSVVAAVLFREPTPDAETEAEPEPAPGRSS